MEKEILTIIFQRTGKTIYMIDGTRKIIINDKCLEKIKYELEDATLHLKIITEGLSLAQVQKIIGSLERVPSLVTNCSREGEIKKFVIEF